MDLHAWPPGIGADPSAAVNHVAAWSALQCLTAFQEAIGQNKVQCSLCTDTQKPFPVMRPYRVMLKISNTS
jgi:hypothetical protein